MTKFSPSPNSDRLYLRIEFRCILVRHPFSLLKAPNLIIHFGPNFGLKNFVTYEHSLNTRMHSSRMRTTRSSSRQPGGLPQCMLGYTLTPMGVGLETPPGVGLEASPGCGPRTPPPVWAWRPPLGVGLETPPPWTDRHV